MRKKPGTLFWIQLGVIVLACDIVNLVLPKRRKIDYFEPGTEVENE